MPTIIKICRTPRHKTQHHDPTTTAPLCFMIKTQQRVSLADSTSSAGQYFRLLHVPPNIVIRIFDMLMSFPYEPAHAEPYWLARAALLIRSCSHTGCLCIRSLIQSQDEGYHTGKSVDLWLELLYLLIWVQKRAGMQLQSAWKVCNETEKKRCYLSIANFLSDRLPE